MDIDTFKYWLSYKYVRYIKRIVCLVRGCDIWHPSSAYMPMDWSPPTYCDRCEACSDPYGYEGTDYSIIYPIETFVGRMLGAD